MPPSQLDTALHRISPWGMVSRLKTEQPVVEKPATASEKTACQTVPLTTEIERKRPDQ